MEKLTGVRIGYGKYETKQELQEAEDKAWLSIPLEERKRIMLDPERIKKEREHARSMGMPKK